MNRITKCLACIGILLAVVVLSYHSPVYASARIALPGTWEADVTFCQDGFLVEASGTLLTGVTTEVSVLTAYPASDTGTVLTFTGPGTGSGAAFFAWKTWQAPGKPVSATLDRSEDGASLTGGAGRIAIDVIGTCVLNPYAGPVLPPPGERNLVFILNDTPVLDAPGGKLTGDMLRMCQTAFVIDTSGGYGEVFVMGGWINLADTLDVDESYGQPGGALIVSGCVSR